MHTLARLGPKIGLKERFRTRTLSREEALEEIKGWDSEEAKTKFRAWLERRPRPVTKQVKDE